MEQFRLTSGLKHCVINECRRQWIPGSRVCAQGISEIPNRSATGFSSCELIWGRVCAFISRCVASRWWCFWAAAINATRRATSARQNNYGNNLRIMRLKDYRTDLLKRLRDANYAAEYLAQVLAEDDKNAFLIA